MDNDLEQKVRDDILKISGLPNIGECYGTPPARSVARDMAALCAATDNVNHPKHYTSGGVECIDAIQSALTPEEFRGFLKGNILKYTWRERLKGGLESLDKAKWYLNKLLGAPLT